MNKVGKDKEPVTSQSGEPDTTLYFAEIEKAAKRIGSRTDQLAMWLIRFATTRLEDLSTGQWTDLFYEVACMAEFNYYAKDEPFLWRSARTIQDWEYNWQLGDDEQLSNLVTDLVDRPKKKATKLIGPLGNSYRGIPTKQAVTKLHDKVVSTFNYFKDHGEISLTLPSIHVTVATVPEQHGTLVTAYAGAPQELFQYNLPFIFARHAHQFRLCKECQKWFFADRKNKTYCSAQCQSRAGTKRWRDTPTEKQGKRGRPAKPRDSQAKGGKHGATKR